MARLSPIPPIILDPRNEADLVSGAIARTIEASNGLITTINPATVESALIEGCAFTTAQLLVYLNLAPEAWTVLFLSQVVGVGIVLDTQAVVVVQFDRGQAYINTTFTVPRGTQISNQTGDKVFATSEDINFQIGEISSTVIAVAVNSGSAFNVLSTESAVLVSLISQISSVSFVIDSFAGEDAESYGDVKSRAFDILHRRSPISLNDWVGFSRDFFGANSKILVTRGTSAGKRYYLDTNNLTLSYDGSLTNLLQLMVSAGYTPTKADVNRFEQILRENGQTNDSIYISVSTGNNDDFSSNILNSFITNARLFTQAGQQIYCNNCPKQYIDLYVIFDKNQQFNEDQVEATLSSVVASYFNGLQPGTIIDYNALFSIASGYYNIKSVMFSTSSTSQFSLNSNLIEAENFRYFLRTTVTNNGSIVYLETRGETIFYYSDQAVAPYNLIEFNSEIGLTPISPDVVWKVANVYASTEITNQPGKLLRCNADGSSVRLDEQSQAINIAKDYACVQFLTPPT